MSTHQEAQPAPSQTVSIHFPENLPVSSRREEIMQAMRAHQVVIVCGETGSGKTTQLPKIALALGRGAMHAAPGQRPRLIGHTQPRRIAASSVAKRIAQELDTPLGEGGIRASEGERRRIALARTLLADFPVIVWDNQGHVHGFFELEDRREHLFLDTRHVAPRYCHQTRYLGN